jgi:HEAT repeat protein
MADSASGWFVRGSAAKILSAADPAGTASNLLRLFLEQTDRGEIFETALTMERAGNQGVVPGLIAALREGDPNHRYAAARALGWIMPVGRQATKALIAALVDKSQPCDVREQAAESLAYSWNRRAIEPLISVLSDPDVRIRFWSVFALGSIGQQHPERRIVEALESMLGDNESPPGWWPVGREALAMLAKLTPQ